MMNSADNEGDNCPYCGWEMDKNDPRLVWVEYAIYVCPECGKTVETPSV
jgi:DNA-directed RNA polymerase subunit RPC12/RpoP